MRKKYPPQHEAPDKSNDLTGFRKLHQPVLLESVLAVLQPKTGESYLDLTAGFGGHAKAMIDSIGPNAPVTLVDRDNEAIDYLKQQAYTGATILHQDFATAAQDLANKGCLFDMVLLDVGVSSPQLDKADRGFAIRLDGPLDMRMDRRQERSADQLVNTASYNELVNIIATLGEESLGVSRRIATAIVSGRPIETTAQLAQIVSQAVSRRRGQKIHPATRTFQALRLSVNDELGQLAKTMPLLPKLLSSGGRLAVITFHSLEDRIVKQYLQEQAGSGLEAQLRLLVKKPITTEHEDVHNPRARSAKLRAAVKINTNNLKLKF